MGYVSRNGKIVFDYELGRKGIGFCQSVSNKFVLFNLQRAFSDVGFFGFCWIIVFKSAVTK